MPSLDLEIFSDLALVLGSTYNPKEQAENLVGVVELQSELPTQFSSAISLFPDLAPPAPDYKLEPYAANRTTRSRWARLPGPCSLTSCY